MRVLVQGRGTGLPLADDLIRWAAEAENFDKAGDRIEYELRSIQSSRHFRTTQPDKAVYVLSI